MERRTIYVGLAIFVVIAGFIAAAILLKQQDSLRGVEYQQPLAASEITLIRADGKTFRLSEQKDKIVILFFGYTFCPDVCPTTMADLKQVYNGLGGNARSVEIVFITVDPGRDTSEHMQDYVDRFNPSFIGLGSSEAELESVWKNYGVFREIVPGTSPTNYSVNHSVRITLIDQNGNLRLSYGYQTPVDDILHDIKLLLTSRDYIVSFLRRFPHASHLSYYQTNIILHADRVADRRGH